MTLGLVLSSESIRYKAKPSEEGRKRIRLATLWLLNNSDLDRDGIPGWGLPQSWDAFSDGSTNPENQPYTITTAIVLQGLLDCASIKEVWTQEELQKIETIMRNVSVIYCTNFWTENKIGGFFWYSPNSNDAYDCPNVSAMMLGNLQRLLSEHHQIFTQAQIQLISDRVDKSAESIIATVRWRNDMPFWAYITSPNKFGRDEGNDLLHHTYIIWGMELYREYGGKLALTWSRKQAEYSLDQYWKSSKIYAFPTDIQYVNKLESFNDMAANLWSVGMMLAYHSKWGEKEKANTCFKTIETEYGPNPNLALLPKNQTNNYSFYPRYAAHVLFGLANYIYASAND